MVSNAGFFKFAVIGALMTALVAGEAAIEPGAQLARQVDDSGLQRMINHPDPNEQNEIDSFILRIHT